MRAFRILLVVLLLTAAVAWCFGPLHAAIFLFEVCFFGVIFAVLAHRGPLHWLMAATILLGLVAGGALAYSQVADLVERSIDSFNAHDVEEAPVPRRIPAPRRAGDRSTRNPAPEPTYSYYEDDRRRIPGLILFNPPKRMTVGQTVHFTLIVSRNERLRIIASDIAPSAGGAVERIQQMLSPFMVATLNGGGDFHVEPRQDNAESQVIPAKGYAIWAWDVTPIHAGNDLLLTLRLFFVNPQQHWENDLARQIQIHVQANIPYQGLRFAEDNWKWLVTAISPPIFFWLRAWIIRRRFLARPLPDYQKPL